GEDQIAAHSLMPQTLSSAGTATARYIASKATDGIHRTNPATSAAAGIAKSVTTCVTPKSNSGTPATMSGRSNDNMTAAHPDIIGVAPVARFCAKAPATPQPVSDRSARIKRAFV